jgi:hypothetical protein
VPRGRNRRIAEAEAKIRFGSERAGLAALVGQAQEEYKTDLRTARGMAATAIRSARKGRRPLRKIYNEAQAAADTAHQDVEAAFGRLGAAADPFKAVTDREFALAEQRRADSAAAARRDLIAQENEAKLGRMFAVGQAKTRYTSTLNQISDRLRDVGDREGAYIVSRLGELREAGTKHRQAIELENIKHEHDLAEIDRRARSGGGRGGGGGGADRASRAELRSFTAKFAKAFSHAKDYSQAGDARRIAADDLTRGVPSSTVVSKGKKLKDPGVPAIDDQLAVAVALDMAYDGVISRRNTQRLHQAGIKVADLPGAFTRAQRQRQQQRGFGGARDELAERY